MKETLKSMARPTYRAINSRFYRFIDVLKAEIERLETERVRLQGAHDQLEQELRNAGARIAELEEIANAKSGHSILFEDAKLCVTGLQEIGLLAVKNNSPVIAERALGYSAEISSRMPPQVPDYSDVHLTNVVKFCLHCLREIAALALDRNDLETAKHVYRFTQDISGRILNVVPEQHDPHLLDMFMPVFLDSISTTLAQGMPEQAEPSSPAGRAVALSVSVWGEDFVDKFTDVLLRSLIAPGNLPALSAKTDVIFYIATTPAGRDRIESSSVMAHVREHARVEYLEIPESLTDISFRPTDTRRYWLYGAFQQISLLFAQRIGADFVPLNPDTIYSDGMLDWLVDKVEQDFDCVCLTSHRLIAENAAPKFAELTNSDGAIALAPQDLIDIGAQYIHPHHKHCYRVPDSTQFHLGTVNMFWETPNALIIHAAHQLPAIISHRVLRDDLRPDFHTIDAGILARIFPTPESWERIAVVEKLDEICFFELTNHANEAPPELGVFSFENYVETQFWRACNDLNAWLFEKRIEMPINIQPGIGLRNTEDVDREVTAIIEAVKIHRPADLATPERVSATPPAPAPAPEQAPAEPHPEAGDWQISPQPLAPIVKYDAKPADLSQRSITKWLTSKTHEKTIEFFEKYPENSLLEPQSRAFLYHAARSMRAQTVIEVGTYFAGTSEVIARALWENGEGVLHTADPYGIDRCPYIISQWPDALQSHVEFHGENSMDFLIGLAAANTVIDIAFIDGNHDFEFALFDVQSAARLLRPGGIMVLDNVEQPGPFAAGMEFLKANPGWSELGQSVKTYSRDRPFELTRCSIPGTAFMVLQAPREIAVAEIPYSTGQFPFEPDEVAKVDLNLKGQDNKGSVHMHLILRAFGLGGGNIEEYKKTISHDVGGKKGRLTVALDEPLVSRMRRRGEHCTQSLEIVLAWEPGDGTATELRLNQAPDAS